MVNEGVEYYSSWTISVKKKRTCPTCLGYASNKPKENCNHPRHLMEYKQIIQRGRNYKKSYRHTINRRKRVETRKRKKMIIELLGGKCVRCGITDLRVLQINHLHHVGRTKRPHESGSDFYLRILDGRRDTSDLDIRCANCNILYEYERSFREELIQIAQ